MLRKSSYLLSVAACGALLASCGGNNTPDPTPTPTPTDTATPTPTPTSPPNFDFTEDFTSTSGGNYIYAYFTPTGEAEVFSDTSRISGNGGISFTVSPESVLFAFPDLSDSVEFTGDQLTGATANLRTYENGDESLQVERPFANALRVTYQRNDSTIIETEPGNLRSRRVTLLGLPVTTTDTPASDLIYTGTPQVVGGLSGTTLPDGVLTQDTTFTVDVAAETISGVIRIFDNDGVPTQVAELEFAADVSTNGTFTDDVTDATFGFTGRFTGGIVGANRDEILLIFSVTHTDGRKYVGSLIGG